MPSAFHIIVPSNVEYTDYAINPYRGCGHNCPYCYSRMIARMTVDAWRNAQLKEFYMNPAITYDYIATKVEQEASAITPGKTLMISTSCDPFQPLEQEYGIMTGILRGLQRAGHIKVLILTKSPYVVNYRTLIQEIPGVEVGFTISCLDDLIRWKQEPEAPSYFVRFTALETLIKEGINTWLSCEPIFPSISPIPLIYKAKEMGVKRIVFGKLNYHGKNHDAWYAEIRDEIVKTCQELDMPFMLKKELRGVPN